MQRFSLEGHVKGRPDHSVGVGAKVEDELDHSRPLARRADDGLSPLAAGDRTYGSEQAADQGWPCCGSDGGTRSTVVRNFFLDA